MAAKKKTLVFRRAPTCGYLPNITILEDNNCNVGYTFNGHSNNTQFNLVQYISNMFFLIWIVEDLYLPLILHYVVLDEVFNMLFPLFYCVL